MISEREREREMAKAGYWINTVRSIPSPYKSHAKSHMAPFSSRPSTTSIASLRRNDQFPLITRKNQERNPRRLVTISTSANGRWKEKWDCEYVFSLQELQLQDLVEEDEDNGDNLVSITLSIEKHASFGLSVDGRIITSFTRKCINCSSPYCREIDIDFNIWVLQSSRHNRTTREMPEIGGDDPSVIYVKPGCEAELDSLIQDTIRLATSAKDTCSESCEKSEPKIQYIGEQKAASTDPRWSRLLELRNPSQ